MKRLIALLLIAIIQIIIACALESTPGDAIVDEPDEPVGQCCAEKYGTSISGTAPLGGSHYWLGLFSNDTLVTFSSPVFLAEGPYSNIALSITVTKYDAVPEGNYSLRVLATNQLEDVGIVSKRSTATEVDIVYIPSYLPSQCHNCCTKGFAFAQVTKQSPNWNDIEAARCTLNNKYGDKLCGIIPGDTTQSHSIVFVKILYDSFYVDIGNDTLDYVWALTGFGKIRFQGDTTFYKRRITEVQGSQYQRLVDIPGLDPVDNIDNEYGLALNAAQGIWSHYHQGVIYDVSNAETAWINRRGDEVRWSGEINKLEADMPGISSDHCKISACEYKRSGMISYKSPRFTLEPGSFLFSDNVTEWNIIYIDSSTVEIWDVNPLP